ncbi:GNAT family N-acetyltransferase [Flexibacterium corallicola]|uniref:GNAT family N-acetyltransferase n=1 Tax=Flexibacterium corallicola TaxID=3037259 RepID=UPI00286F2A52|nr:GNAT family N-acetyltransferase [Pseudovibrio sp. M1P-2-3]
MCQISITQATPSQYDEITQVWERSVRASHAFLSEDDITELKPLVRNHYLASVKLYCAQDSHTSIVGFLGVFEQKIEMLFVDAECRGKRTGSRLLKFAIEVLGANCVDVNEQNTQAVTFYLQNGFKQVGRSPLDGLGKPFPLLHLEITDTL